MTLVRSVMPRACFLDEVILDDKGDHMFVCSDSDHCRDRRAEGHMGPRAREAAEKGYGADQ